MICRICNAPMTLDALVANDARRALDPGQPAPVVMRCLNAHTERLDPSDPAPPPTFRPTPSCAVCGTEIPRQVGAGLRKSCSDAHRRFIATKRAEAQAAHNRLHRVHRADAPFAPFHFIIEAQPWYRGAATTFQPPAARAVLVVPPGPDFPEIPASWLEGFRRIYPVLELAPALVGAFPALEELREDEPPASPWSRRRRRARTPRPPTPYPVLHA